MAIIIMIPLIFLSGEYEAIMKYSPSTSSWTYVSYLVILTGILGFGINIAVFLQIKYTSPLTSVIVGAAKSVLQTVLSIIIFQNEISFVNGIGLFINLTGTSYYAYVRYAEMKKAQRAKSNKLNV